MATKNRRDQKMEQVEVAIHVDAPPEAIWAYMADLPFLRALPFTTMEVIGEPGTCALRVGPTTRGLA